MTGKLLNGANKNGSITPEAGSHRIIFDPSSHSNVSHIIPVINKPLVVRAYNLSANETIDILQFCTKFNLQTQVIYNSLKWQLNEQNNLFVIAIPGDYKFRLNGELGYVTCIADEFDMLCFKY